MDLSNKSIEELNSLQAAIESEKEAAKAREMEGFYNLVEAVKLKADVLGINLKEVLFPRAKAEPKVYRDPDTGETFSWKGPRPEWLKAKLAGIDPADRKAIKAKIAEFLVQ